MTSPFLNSKYVPPLEPANPLYCILVWSIYTLCKWEAVSRGGTYFKIENGDQPISLIIDRIKLALIHVSMICMRNKVKTKASILQQYLLCLVAYQIFATKTVGNYVFSSLNIRGVRKCKY